MERAGSGVRLSLDPMPETRFGYSLELQPAAPDAIDLCYSKSHIDMFALVSGDSDFSPLVSKLKENDKRVIGCGVRSSTSDLLANNCDEFIFYEDIVQIKPPKPAPAKKPPTVKPASEPARDAPMTAAREAISSSICTNTPSASGRSRTICSAIPDDGVIG